MSMKAPLTMHKQSFSFLLEPKRVQAVATSLRQNADIAMLILDYATGLEQFHEMEMQLCGMSFFSANLGSISFKLTSTLGIAMFVIGSDKSFHGRFEFRELDFEEGLVALRNEEALEFDLDYSSVQFRNTLYFKRDLVFKHS